jgi:hypothetical protein
VKLAEVMRGKFVLRRDAHGAVVFGGRSVDVLYRGECGVHLHRILTIPGNYCSPEQRDDLVLYFPLIYEGADLVYQCRPTGEIEVLDLGEYNVEDDWPYHDYPRSFPSVYFEALEVSTELNAVLDSADETIWNDLVDPLDHTGLSKGDAAFLESIGFPFYIQVGGSQLFEPSSVWEGCMNSKCESSGMGFVASIWSDSVSEISIWGELCEYVQLLFYRCPECHAVFGFNRHFG